jgi:SAM-dependent methyltransferase
MNSVKKIDECDLDKLMQKIREEIDVNRRGLYTEELATPAAENAEMQIYTVDELFNLSDVEFIRAAYRLLLGREVDSSGFSSTLENLRLGRSDRYSVLHNLSRSEEGRRLAAPVKLPSRRRPLKERLDPRKVIHRLLGIREFVKLGRQLKCAQRGSIPLQDLPFVVNDLRRRLAVTETAIEGVGKLREAEVALQVQLKSVEARIATAEATIEDLPALRDTQIALLGQTRSFEARIDSVEGDLQSLSGYIKRIEGSIDEHGRRFPEMRAEMTRMDIKAQDLWRHISDQARSLNILINEARRRLPDPLDAEQLRVFTAEGEKLLSALYVSFEDRFRGTREDIMQRQSIYLPHVKEAAGSTGAASFVDIGCGRGEFLELLRANGLSGRGVDLNPVMIAECRERGLEAIEGDALTVLRGLPSASVAGISGFHIIEHVPYRVLIELFDEALRILTPGGLLIFETPNPANLLVAAERFYVDPTHLNPLPSETISFTAEARGFVRVAVLPLHPVPGQLRDYGDPMLALLQDKIYGPQDYGLIAWKAQ